MSSDTVTMSCRTLPGVRQNDFAVLIALVQAGQQKVEGPRKECGDKLFSHFSGHFYGFTETR